MRPYYTGATATAPAVPQELTFGNGDVLEVAYVPQPTLPAWVPWVAGAGILLGFYFLSKR